MSTALSESTSQGTFTDAEFDTVAKRYGADVQGTKFKRLFDAVAALGVDDREDHLARVDELISLARSMRDHGAGYTPPADKGFGSDNAAIVAEKILGEAQTVGSTRTALASYGKTIR